MPESLQSPKTLDDVYMEMSEDVRESGELNSIGETTEVSKPIVTMGLLSIHRLDKVSKLRHSVSGTIEITKTFFYYQIIDNRGSGVSNKSTLKDAISTLIEYDRGAKRGLADLKKSTRYGIAMAMNDAKEMAKIKEEESRDYGRATFRSTPQNTDRFYIDADTIIRQRQPGEPF